MKDLEQMTLERLTALQKEKIQHYTELYEQITDIKYDLFKINPILAQKMSHRSPLIGKKVKVVAQQHSESTKPYIIIGFFGGYFAPRFHVSICPILYKIKKDGTASKNKYSDYDVPSLERIISIEEVTE